MPVNQVKGILAYNQIRSELSKEVKAKGIVLEKGAFNTLTKDIFRHNKGEPINPILTNIEQYIIEEREPDIGTFGLQPSLLGGFRYYEFYNNFITEGMHEDLYIVSDLLPEPILAKDLDYHEHIAPIVSFIDKNRTNSKDPDPSFWFYDYAVILKFTTPEFNPLTMRYESRLYISNIYSMYDNKRLPYEPGMSGYYDPVDLMEVLQQIGEPTITEEMEEPEKEEKERKERLIEIEKETELEKEKGITAKEKRLLIAAETKLLDKYTKLYDRGLLTKKQFQAKIDKLG